jgi:ferredoxin
MPRVTFQRQGGARVVTVAIGQDLLRAALGAGLPLASSCGGEGACKACRVEVLAGASALSPPTERERRALESAGAAPTERLACAAQLFGDVTVTTSYW